MAAAEAAAAARSSGSRRCRACEPCRRPAPASLGPTAARAVMQPRAPFKSAHDELRRGDVERLHRDAASPPVRLGVRRCEGAQHVRARATRPPSRGELARSHPRTTRRRTRRPSAAGAAFPLGGAPSSSPSALTRRSRPPVHHTSRRAAIAVAAEDVRKAVVVGSVALSRSILSSGERYASNDWLTNFLSMPRSHVLERIGSHLWGQIAICTAVVFLDKAGFHGPRKCRCRTSCSAACSRCSSRSARTWRTAASGSRARSGASQR